MSEIRIANDNPWQKKHWRSICTAYNSSSYFEFYKDDLEKVYLNMKHDLLIELNSRLTTLILQLLGLKIDITYTDTWNEPVSDDDPRVRFSKGSPVTGIPPYPQVFSYKFGFTDGLSILDLLFNKGPDSVSHLNMHADEG
jgi:hypothetical protein